MAGAWCCLDVNNVPLELITAMKHAWPQLAMCGIVQVNQNALLASLDAGPAKVSARPVASRANTIAPQHSLTHSDSAIGQLPSAFEIHAASQPPPQPPVTDMGYVGPQDDIEAAIQVCCCVVC